MGSLQALAVRQGATYSTGSAEQPGRILHELRAGEVVLRPDGWGAVYYGSVDATPLFVATLAELWRWGASATEVADLLPAAERAVAWILGDGDADGDGLVEYGGARRTGVASLANQGWKDSDDAVRHPDGTLAEGPIAMVEVQGYCHAALLAMAELRDAFGTGDPAPLRARAASLAEAIEDRYWMEDEDCYALALDGAKRPVRSVSTNAGHLLWTGTARPDRSRRLAARLMAEDMFTGFGLRTLSAANGGYNPLSYHCGSVWPHDTALVAAGMAGTGCHAEAGRLAEALLDAAWAFGGRPPELFGGFAADEFARPVPYPTSCSPQAWAAAAPVLLVTALLGLRPDVPGGAVTIDPHLPEGWALQLTDVPLGDHHLRLQARGDELLTAHAGGLRVLGPAAS
jgi:glycogen debranching enzyme